MANLYLLNTVMLSTPGVDKATIYRAGFKVSDPDLQARIVDAGGIFVKESADTLKVASKVLARGDSSAALLVVAADPTGTSDSFFGETALTNEEWHINATSGNDLNDGTSSSPLASLTEYANRIGTFKTLSFDSGKSTVNLHGDIGSGDSLAIKTLLASGSGILVKGTKTVVATGVVSNIVPQNYTSNQNWVVENATASSSDFWASLEGLAIEITGGTGAGSRAFVRKDLGTKQAIVSEWASGNPFPDGFLDMGDPPDVDSTFQVVQYSTIVLGNSVVGYDNSYGNPPGNGGIGGLLIQNCRIVGDIASLGTALGYPETSLSIADSTIETTLDCSVGQNFNLFNVCVKDGGHVNCWPGSTVYQGLGTYLEDEGLTVLKGCHFISDSVSFHAPDFGFGPEFKGWTTTGPLEFYGSSPLIDNCLVEFQGNSPFYGIGQTTPFWGDQTGTVGLRFQNGGILSIQQFKFNDDTPSFPNTTSQTGKNWRFLAPFHPNDTADQSITQVYDGTTYGPIDNTWDNLAVDAGMAGGFRLDNTIAAVNGGNTTTYFAVSSGVGNTGCVQWCFLTFIPD